MSRRTASGVHPTVPRDAGTALRRWFRTHRRPLPWRRDRDPYRIWVAEVLLQQTRVEQAIPYYDRFLARFPTVTALAHARVSDVMKAWEGAGYYARARHLHAAARVIDSSFGGAVPRTVPELETLPGVGPYIARAVASLAFDAHEVALEANALRVAARWTREEGDVRTATVRDRLRSALEPLLPDRDVGQFNEAVMELGETVCRPRAPLCGRCPVRTYCRAHLELDDPGSVPRPPVRAPRPHVVAAVAVLEHRGRWLVQLRPPKGLLGGLWEFPGGKVEPSETPRDAARRELREETGIVAPALASLGAVEHAYSHFSVTLHVFAGSVASLPPAARGRWVTPRGLGRLPRPKATEKVAELVERSRDRASPGSGSRPDRTPAGPPSAVGGQACPTPAQAAPVSTARSRARH